MSWKFVKKFTYYQVPKSALNENGFFV